MYIFDIETMGIGIQFGDTLLIMGVLTCVVSITWTIIIF